MVYPGVYRRHIEGGIHPVHTREAYRGRYTPCTHPRVYHGRRDTPYVHTPGYTLVVIPPYTPWVYLSEIRDNEAQSGCHSLREIGTMRRRVGVILWVKQ